LNPDFPLHTAIWISFNMILVALLAVLCLNESFSRMAMSSGTRRTWQATIIVSFVTWFVLRMILGHTRVVPPGQLILLSSFAFYFGVMLAMGFFSIFRQTVLSIPQNRLIGIQSFRILGFVFLALLDMRLLPPQFALPAGYGDIIVGLTAPLVVHVLNKQKPLGRGLAIGWNFLGLLDFAVALVTGFLFIGPYVRQLALTGHSIAYLDYVLMIPGFGVPILVMIHITSLFGLLTKNGANPEKVGPVPR
jgi:hypothetical protein